MTQHYADMPWRKHKMKFRKYHFRFFKIPCFSEVISKEGPATRPKNAVYANKNVPY